MSHSLSDCTKIAGQLIHHFVRREEWTCFITFRVELSAKEKRKCDLMKVMNALPDLEDTGLRLL